MSPHDVPTDEELGLVPEDEEPEICLECGAILWEDPEHLDCPAKGDDINALEGLV